MGPGLNVGPFGALGMETPWQNGSKLLTRPLHL